MDLSADLSVFFSDFGFAAVISVTDLEDRPVTVLFDRFSLEETGMLTDKPQITIRESDLAGVDLETATITVAGATWKLIKPLSDGAGMVIGRLKRN